MYLAGAAHPNREIARSLLDTVIAAGEPIVTDAEVLQLAAPGFSARGAVGRASSASPALRRAGVAPFVCEKNRREEAAKFHRAARPRIFPWRGPA